MSGPKVVRIVTREEIMAMCEGHLSRLDAALEDWVRIGRRNDCVSEEEVAAGQRRREAIAKLLASDRFMDVQKQAPQEIAFLANDLEARLRKVADQAAAERSSARRQAEAAKTLLGALRAAENLPPDLENRLQQVVDGETDSKAIADGFAALSAKQDHGAAARHALAQRHRTDEKLPSLEEWLRRQTPAAEEGRLRSIDRRLAELTLTNAPAAAAFGSRLDTIMVEASAQRKNLLLDSLELDVGHAVKETKARVAAEREVQLALAELSVASPEHHARLACRQSDSLDAAGIDDLLTEIRSAIEGARKAAAAAARRQALIEGLATMGYEISEGMETAWATEGRVVLRSAARPDYGVEVAGDAAAGRVQMRAVAFEHGGVGPDAAQDTDAETIWCGEVGALQDRLATLGGGLTIERALAVGATPLKRVATGLDGDRHRAREGPADKTRTLS